MTDPLDDLAGWLQPLITALQPAERRRLALRIARELRRETQASMRAQQSPDGEPWQARRARIVLAHGVRSDAQRARQRRGPMMVKLRQARYLPTTATPDEAALTFAGRVLRIARVHRLGLTDRVAPDGPTHDYAARPLIGLGADGIQRLKSIVLDHLADALQKK